MAIDGILVVENSIAASFAERFVACAGLQSGVKKAN